MATKKKAKRAPARKPARTRKAPARRKVAPVPPQYGSITPALVIRGAADAIEFYRKAFGAKELMRMPGPGGKVMHAEIKIGDSILMLSDESPEMGARSPQALGGTAASVMLYVKDCDAVFRQAIDAGARSVQEPQDMFWGDRYSKLVDPFGHEWGVLTAKEKLSQREVARRMAAWEQQQGAPQG
jgi:PhnB protein